ncbi:MAG TPA: WD40 repeat domain-containing protein [Candidatus Binatia bacterium]|jgi:WD40 repeat protein|nr:WD40 repeat domain-containing protein [Candidatus Binatia bacterium]
MSAGAAAEVPAWEAEKPSVDDESPWPGLESFREADQRYFHGREVETDLLLALIRRARLTVLCGVPGFGKTSLLQAAVFPRLRAENHLPVYLRIDYGDGAPSLRRQVLDALAKAVRVAAVEAPPIDETATLWEYFHRRGAEFWSARSQPVVPVLVIDQFEEAFTLGRAGTERSVATRAFLTELGDLIEGRVPHALRQAIDREPTLAAGYAFTMHAYRIVLSLREDYLAELESLRDEVPALSENRLRLERMRGPNAVAAVIQSGGRLIPAGMGERIVRFTVGGSKAPLDQLAVEPWLLSLVCGELNKRRRERREREITPDLLEASQTEILGNFYDGCVKDLDPSVRRFVEEDLLTESGARNSEDIENALGRGLVNKDDLQRLIDRRLLRIEDRGGRSRVELTHDVLAPVLQRSRDLHRELERRAEQEATERDRLRRRVQRSRAVAAVALVVVLLGAAVLFKVVAERNRAQLALATTAQYQGHVARDGGRRAPALARLAYALRLAPNAAAASAALFSVVVYDHVHGEVFSPVGAPFVHGQPVRWAAFSRDGKRVVTASSDGTAQVWEVESGTRLGPPLRHRGPVVYAAFHRDGRRVVTASDDGTAQVWEVGSSKPIGPPLRHRGPVRTALFSQDRVVTASADHTVRVWDVGSGKPVGRALSHKDDVLRASSTQDGSRLLSVSTDGTAKVWELVSKGGRDHYVLGRTLRHRGIRSGQLSRDGRRVVTASDDGTAQVWDLEHDDWKRVGGPLVHAGPVSWAAFSADGQRVVTASADRTARIWHLAPGSGARQWQSVTLEHGSAVTSASFSSDGRWVATASTDGNARVWEAQTGRPVGRPLHHDGPVAFAFFSSDATRLVTASADGTARVWMSRPLGEPLWQIASGVEAATLSPDGTSLVSLDRDTRTAQLWRIDLRQREGGPYTNTAQSIATMLTPDRRWMITTDGKAAKIWDRTRGVEVATLPHADVVLSAAFHPDGRHVVTASADKVAQLWSETGDDGAHWERMGGPLRHEASVNWAVFSDDGRYVATAARDDTIHVWLTETQVEVGKPRRHPGVRSVAFSADGSRLATAAWDGSARLWEVATGEALPGQPRHESVVTSVAFSPDGRWLATASADRTARVWDAATGSPVSVPFMHLDRVLAARFTPDSRWLVTVSADGLVQRWEIGVGIPSDAPILADLAESIAELRVNEQGGDEQLGQAAHRPTFDSDGAAASPIVDSLLRWLELDPRERPVSPSSQVRIEDALEHRAPPADPPAAARVAN